MPDSYPAHRGYPLDLSECYAAAARTVAYIDRLNEQEMHERGRRRRLRFEQAMQRPRAFAPGSPLVRAQEQLRDSFPSGPWTVAQWLAQGRAKLRLLPLCRLPAERHTLLASAAFARKSAARLIEAQKNAVKWGQA